MQRRNIIAAVVLIVCSLIYGGLTSQIPKRSLPHTPDPSFFPWIVTAIVLCLSVALLVQGLRAGGPSGGDAALVPMSARNRRMALAMVAGFLAYLIVLPWLGFIPATLPFFAALMVMFGERRPVPVAAGALLVTALLYVIFRHGFGIFLPRGLLAGIVA